MTKTKKFTTVFIAAGVAACLSAGMAFASTFGSMQGKVTDASGQPVAGAKVSLAGEGAATTDKSGFYNLDGIDPGTYQVEATKKGFQKSTLTVTITQDVPQELDLTLTSTDTK